MESLTPKQIVDQLDIYIIGQEKAKKSVAIALRNRYRRLKLADELKDEVIPKNILMIGPTGVGKTEIARRLAKLADAPFIKVEATKFTEVGYVGRDVESMVRDLIETAIRQVKQVRIDKVADKAKDLAEDRILDILVPLPRKENKLDNPLGMLFGGMNNSNPDEDSEYTNNLELAKERRKLTKEKLTNGELEEEIIEIEVEDSVPPMVEIFSGSGVEEMGINLQDMFGGFLPKKKKKRKVNVGDARKIFQQEEAQKLIDLDEVIRDAINKAEQSGIIFIDEIDKIAGKGYGGGPDVSREGVQRDILPIIEGSTIITKHGAIKTDHILFIGAGAFHVSKPSDLIPELQGRFPIRVEMENLSTEDFKKILTQPRNALIKQYIALLQTEGVEITFEDGAIDEIAHIACLVNQETENIGARRLHTILERLLEDLSFQAPELNGQKIVINKKYVEDKLKDISENEDLSRYIL